VICFFEGLGSFGHFVGKVRQKALIGRKESFIHSNADQRRGDALGYGCDIMQRVLAIGIEVRIHHDIAVAKHGDAVDVQVLLRNTLDHLGEHGRIETLRFGRRLAPVRPGK
jgi:hypothetical protein